jgi:uncharacterized membrane protein YhaH (DUF805 family)
MIGDLSALFFSPYGRASRSQYIAVQGVTLMADAAVQLYIKLKMTALALNSLNGGAFGWLDIFQHVGRGLLYVSFVISLKRLRDMGQSKWWLAPIYGPGIIMTSIVAFSVELMRFGERSFAYAVLEPIASALTSLLTVVDLTSTPAMLCIYVIMYGFKLWLATSPSIYDRSASPLPLAATTQANIPFIVESSALPPAPGQTSRATVKTSFGRRNARTLTSC